ncbi:MAG: hypothetical protein ACPGUF_04920 [Litorivicinus sp.]
MNIPSTIRAGDTVKWRDDASIDAFGAEVTNASWTLKYYLRTNTASEGATVTGSAYGTGWEFTLSATTSAAFDAGDWYWSAVATRTSPDETLTLGTGFLTVKAALSYSGTPGAYDGRTQAEKDLDAVQAAIRAIVDGGVVQEYRIGTRNLKKYDLPDLIQLEGKLKAEVKREQQAELMANGLGNPRNMFVRFNP